jgi:hypothetical protein
MVGSFDPVTKYIELVQSILMGFHGSIEQLRVLDFPGIPRVRFLSPHPHAPHPPTTASPATHRILDTLNP